MDVLKPIFSIAKNIYDLCEKASANKNQCSRLKIRIARLLRQFETSKLQPDKSKKLDTCVEELQQAMKNAEAWVIKYSNRNWLRKTFQANKIKAEFDSIIDHLNDVVQDILLFLLIEQIDDNHKAEKRHEKDKKALKEDLEEYFQMLKNLLMLSVAAVPALPHVHFTLDTYENADSVDHINVGVLSISEVLENLQRALIPWKPKMIAVPDLRRVELLVERPNYNLFRGEYQTMPVAIKVLKGPLNNDETIVKKTFETECKTMTNFECYNILRVYGICIDKTNRETCYSLVTELCEKGTLRALLERESDLSWEQRLNMALDSARALFKLHCTEKKAVLHGSLSSFKFLVDRSYTLKLSGFELTSTESSMRKKSNMEKQKKNRDLAYIAPETLQDINAYNMLSEIYSLGIVMWEIASGRAPLQGLADVHINEIYEKRCEENEHYIPEDCPAVLRDIIIKSQSKDPNKRPSAGVIVSNLTDYMNWTMEPLSAEPVQ